MVNGRNTTVKKITSNGEEVTPTGGSDYEPQARFLHAGGGFLHRRDAAP
jgi:hypothetical protein